MSEQRYKNIPDNNQDDQNDQKIIDLASNVAKEFRNTSEYPPHYNLVNEFSNLLNEDKHSDILAHLLEIEEVQQSFIKFFFKDLALDKPYDVLTRKGYPVNDRRSIPDILLENSESLIIIENKIEGAAEQHEQMYRYVHDVGISNFHKKVNQIYVLYLKGSDRIRPTKYSTAKKDGENQIDVMEELKGRFLVRNYSEDIVKWIDEFINQNQYNENMRYVRSALFQYKDFLTYHKFKNDPDIIKEATMICNKINDSNIFNEKIMIKKENKVDIKKEDIKEYNNNIKNLDLLKDRIPKLKDKLLYDIKERISKAWLEKFKVKCKEKNISCPAEILCLDSPNEGIYVPLKMICKQFPLPENSPEDKKTFPYNFPEDKELLLGLFVNLNTEDKYKIKPWVGLYSDHPDDSYWKFVKCLSKRFKKYNNLGDVIDRLSDKEYGGEPDQDQKFPLWTFTEVDNGPKCFYNWFKAITEILSQKK